MLTLLCSKLFIRNHLSKFVGLTSTTIKFYKILPNDKVLQLDENTLHSRMLKSLNIRKNIIKPELTSKYTSTIRSRLYKDLSPNELANVIYVWTDMKYTEKPREAIVEFAEKECMQRLITLSTHDTFNLLDALMLSVPSELVHLKFYKRAIRKLFQEVPHMPKDQLVKFCFFVGISKKSNDSKAYLNACIARLKEKVIKSLSLEEVCIISSATFKCSLKITNRLFLDKIVKTIVDNLQVLNDPALFVTLVKTIRLNRCQTEDLLKTICCTIFFNNTVQYYNFAAISHILPLYSDVLCYDENLFNLLYSKAIDLLDKSGQTVSATSHLSKEVRSKDLCTFLWALSHIGYDYFDERCSRKVCSMIENFIEIGAFTPNIEDLFGSLLSLCMLDELPERLVLLSLTQENVKRLRAKNKWKYNARLNLLLTCIELENKNLFDRLNVDCATPPSFSIPDHIQKRPSLKTLAECLSELADEYGIQNIAVATQIPNLNIAGVRFSLEDGRVCNFELLDEETCVSNLDLVPHGLMRLKFRLLKSFQDQYLCIVAKSDFESHETLTRIIRNKLQAVTR